MGVYPKNRALMISLALAASGILTCGLALADVFLPRGSAVVLLASIPLLGGFAFGVLIIFAWTCDLLDRHGYFQAAGRTACKSEKPWTLVGARGPNRFSADESQRVAKTTPPLQPLIDYPVNLRGRMRFQGDRWVSGRHGQ